MKQILLAIIAFLIQFNFGCTPPAQSTLAAKRQSPSSAKGFQVSTALLSTGPCGDADRALVSFVSGDGHFHLNGETYSDHQQFGLDLAEILLRRNDPSVYLIANPGLEFQQVVDVVDELESRKAKMILLSHAVAEDPKNCGPIWLPSWDLKPSR